MRGQGQMARNRGSRASAMLASRIPPPGIRRWRKRRMMGLTRRHLIGGGLALGGGWLVSGCSTAASPSSMATGMSSTFPTPSRLTPTAGQKVVERTLKASPFTADLGGVQVATWGYDGVLPGPEIRAKAGDLLRLTLDNQLPADTTIHWHGIALRNAADGVPGMTQAPTASGQSFLYEFVAPDPGTYFFHPHVGVQLDRGLYGAMIIEDPNEPGSYDEEWVVVLDDWLDGTGRTPDEALAKLVADGAGGGGHMDHDSMGEAPFGNAGDITYPYFLINGAVPTAPKSFEGKPGMKVRIRLINAASDTLFSVALGEHTFVVTHTDGFAVQPTEASALYIGMGERYDITVTLGDGVFPLVAKPWGKEGQAMALVKTGAGTAPAATVSLAEFTGPILQGVDLTPTEAARLPAGSVDRVEAMALGGQMKPYVWTINGAPFGQHKPIGVNEGQRLQIDVTNQTMMTHPVHVHGHTFALPNGLRKDTVLVAPMGKTSLTLDANNPGEWAAHCHNIYHGEAGMMIALQYS